MKTKARKLKKKKKKKKKKNKKEKKKKKKKKKRKHKQRKPRTNNRPFYSARIRKTCSKEEKWKSKKLRKKASGERGRALLRKISARAFLNATPDRVLEFDQEVCLELNSQKGKGLNGERARKMVLEQHRPSKLATVSR